MSKTSTIILFLLSAVILLSVTGCSSPIDEEYTTVFKEDFKSMEPQTPFQETTKKYLERMYGNNQDFKGNLDISGFSFDEFTVAGEFKNIEKLELLKEKTQSQKESFKEYFSNHSTFLDEWNTEITVLKEGGKPQFSEEFFKKFKKDFKKHRERMLYLQYFGDDYFESQISFIDFIIENNQNFFVPENALVFYNGTIADKCLRAFLTQNGLKKAFFKDFDKVQNSWSENLRISNDFSKYEEFTVKCYPSSGLSAEENYKRETSIGLDVSVKLSIKKAELTRLSQE